MKRSLKNQKGFTLIELMIVIAIIGILAAIAIPNFISYRNKSFCSGVESDANNIAAAIANYFAIPSNTSISDANVGVATNLSNMNTWTVNAADIDAITITVTDASGRCPTDYSGASSAATNPSGYWSSDTTYLKIMSN